MLIYFLIILILHRLRSLHVSIISSDLIAATARSRHDEGPFQLCRQLCFLQHGRWKRPLRSVLWPVERHLHRNSFSAHTWRQHVLLVVLVFCFFFFLFPHRSHVCARRQWVTNVNWALVCTVGHLIGHIKTLRIITVCTRIQKKPTSSHLTDYSLICMHQNGNLACETQRVINPLDLCRVFIW